MPIVRTPPPPFLKGGIVNLDYHLRIRGDGGGRGGESEKLKKGGGSMFQGQVFLKRGRGADTFPVLFSQGLSFLHLEITLPFAKLRYAFEKKIFFSVTIFL